MPLWFAGIVTTCRIGTVFEECNRTFLPSLLVLKWALDNLASGQGAAGVRVKRGRTSILPKLAPQRFKVGVIKGLPPNVLFARQVKCFLQSFFGRLEMSKLTFVASRVEWNPGVLRKFGFGFHQDVPCLLSSTARFSSG